MVFEFLKNIDFQGLQESLKGVIFSLFHNLFSMLENQYFLKIQTPSEPKFPCSSDGVWIFKNIDFQGLQRSLKVVIISLFHNYLLKFAEILLKYILELSENILIV